MTLVYSSEMLNFLLMLRFFIKFGVREFTGKFPLMYINNGLLDERETEMMNVRWRIF